MEGLVGAYCCTLDGFCYDEREEAMFHLSSRHENEGYGSPRLERDQTARATAVKVHDKLRCLEEGYLLDQ